jgi:hypothetical protein
LPTEVVKKVPSLKLHEVPIYIEKEVIKEVPVSTSKNSISEMPESPKIEPQEESGSTPSITLHPDLQHMARRCESIDSRII